MARESACPISRVIALLGNPCSMLIIRDLLAGPRRFVELERSLSSSTRTLSLKLRHLEKEGLVRRRQQQGRVEYSLTKKGAGLQKVEQAMRAYGKKYL